MNSLSGDLKKKRTAVNIRISDRQIHSGSKWLVLFTTGSALRKSPRSQMNFPAVCCWRKPPIWRLFFFSHSPQMNDQKKKKNEIKKEKKKITNGLRGGKTSGFAPVLRGNRCWRPLRDQCQPGIRACVAAGIVNRCRRNSDYKYGLEEE